jgi:hypothetical protein
MSKKKKDYLGNISKGKGGKERVLVGKEPQGGLHIYLKIA